MVRIKLTEKSYRKGFITTLNLFLEKHDMIIFDDPSLSYVDKHNSKKKTHFPDIVIASKDKVSQEGEFVSISKDGVVGVIETKKSTKHVYDGFRQATDYMTTLNTKHAFSTNFKDVVGIQIIDGRPQIDERLNKKLDEESMSSVIDFIVSVLIKTKQLQPIELNDDLIVKILESAVTEMLEFMKGVESEKLEEPLGFFFQKKLDTELLKSKDSKKEFDLAIKKGAAYLVINQILFYHILSTESYSDYQPLQEVNSPTELQKYFDRVLQDDYRSIFGAKVSTFLPKSSSESINSIIRAVNVLGLQRVKHDILGKIFHGLIPQELRKRIAAYYTSNAAGQLLAELCIDNKDAKVLDPACGSGTLLVSSYRRKRELYHEDSEGIHKKLLTQIYGGDISLFAAHLAAIHLALQEPLSFTDEIHIVLGDFFDVTPKKNLLDWLNQERTMKKVSAESVKDVQFSIPYVDLIVMNPPFTRMELLDQNYKKFIESSFQRSDKKGFLQGRMGLHALFLLHSDDFLKAGGKIAAVLPASTFYTGYGKELEHFFLSKYNVKYIISSDVETAFSEQSTFKEILFVAEKKQEKQKTTQKTLFISLKVPLTLKNAREIAHKIRNLDREENEDNLVRVNSVTTKELAEENNWNVFSDTTIKMYIKLSTLPNVIKAEKYLDGHIVEGIRRFPINFFYLPNKFWEITDEKEHDIRIQHLFTKEKLSIPKKILVPSIRKPEMYKTIQLKPSHYLLTLHPNEKITKDLERYIELAEKMNLDKESSTLVKTVKKENIPWYSYTYLLRKNPKIFGKVFVIDKLRVNTGKIMAHYIDEKTASSGMFHTISIDSSNEGKILTLWYNSNIHMFMFLFRGRAIQGGYYRALISDLKKLPMINIVSIDEKTRKEMIAIFDKFSKKELPSFPKQIELQLKKDIDLLMLKSMGASNPEALLKQIYKCIYDKIEMLRTESV